MAEELLRVMRNEIPEIGTRPNSQAQKLWDRVVAHGKAGAAAKARRKRSVHLNESQRAMVAALMGVLKNGKRGIFPTESFNDIAKLCNIDRTTAWHGRQTKAERAWSSR